MEQLTDLKAILTSKRANIYFLEYCRVIQKDGRIVYVTDNDNRSLYWNIPIANTTCILLGNGTSITQAAMRMVAQAGVMVGFAGGGGTPLIATTEIEWLSPASEYRPTEYVQSWLKFWFDDDKRIEAAKMFQKARVDTLIDIWDHDVDFKQYNFNSSIASKTIDTFLNNVENADSIQKLLSAEAHYIKSMYKHAVSVTDHNNFKRDNKSERGVNSFLTHGNYLTYGLAASTLWVLGIPHAFAVMHGKTRRGALVFDVADVVKDAIIIPTAFIAHHEKLDESQFRQKCLGKFIKHKALDRLFNVVKVISESMQS